MTQNHSATASLQLVRGNKQQVNNYLPQQPGNRYRVCWRKRYKIVVLDMGLDLHNMVYISHIIHRAFCIAQQHIPHSESSSSPEEVTSC